MGAFNIADLNRLIEDCVGADEAVPVGAAELDVDFDSLGLDSLGVYEVTTLIEERWQVYISDEALDAIHTPRALIDHVETLVTSAEAR